MVAATSLHLDAMRAEVPAEPLFVARLSPAALIASPKVASTAHATRTASRFTTPRIYAPDRPIGGTLRTKVAGPASAVECGRANRCYPRAQGVPCARSSAVQPG